MTIYIKKMSAVFIQDDEDNDNRDQTLTMDVNSQGAGGYITFKTNRWSVDVEELSTLFSRMEELVKLHDKWSDEETKKFQKIEEASSWPLG